MWLRFVGTNIMETMCFYLRYQKVESGGESILQDLRLHPWLRPQYFLRCELY
ncbi:Uncharacterized protein FKW44_006514, partial [Caligus rogercresseyi]